MSKTLKNRHIFVKKSRTGHVTLNNKVELGRSPAHFCANRFCVLFSLLTNERSYIRELYNPLLLDQES